MLAIESDHLELAAVVRKFATEYRLTDAARVAADSGSAALPDYWSKIAELGWLGMHVPESMGGAGAGLIELSVVLDELGHAIAPGLMLPSVVAATVLTRSDGRAGDWLVGLMDGSVLAGLALDFTGGPDGHGVVSGSCDAVIGGSLADILLVRVGPDLLVLPASDPCLTIVPLAGMDPSLGLARVTVTGLRRCGADVLAGQSAHAVAAFRLLACAQAAGGIRGCLDRALEYAKFREQFGRTIGSFQVIKHQLADLLVDSQMATALVWDAAEGSQAGTIDVEAVAHAASFVPDAFQRAAHAMIQLHGAIGFTWEHDAHLFLRRAMALRALLSPLGSAPIAVYEAALLGEPWKPRLTWPADAEHVRSEVRSFIAQHRASAEGERRRLLAESGYLVPHWPRPFGRHAAALEQLVIEDELADLAMPDLGIGGWVMLTLVQTARPDQAERWVWPGLRGEVRWCQLFSEPSAGSDAAAIRTRADRVVGGWRINGQKVWTSGAADCHWGLATVRTDPSAPKHRGITAMVIDLTAPGVTVRPLREMSGTAYFCEVFFDDVFVPEDDLVGEVNDGWRVARATLGNERVSIGVTVDGIPAGELVELAERMGGPTDLSKTEIAHLLVEARALRVMVLRQVVRALSRTEPGPEGSITKLLAAEHGQRVTVLGMALAGTSAITDGEPALTRQYLLDRSRTIAGGTSEISRNVIAERVLRLPRESAVS